VSGPSLSAVDGLGSAAAELRAHGYLWPQVRERTGLDWQMPFPLTRLDEVDTPHVPEDERPAVDWLIRLLLLGDDVPAARADALLSRPAREALERAGLLERRGDAVCSRALVLPWEDLLLACDWPWLDTPARVIVPDPSSAFTAEHVAPLAGEPTGTAVDVGTGCGIIAFVAARHFDRVFGVDTNARAIEFARFNAALNGLDVSFEPCSTAFLAEELGEPVDLVTFVLPVLFPDFWRRAAPAHISQVESDTDGKHLALGVYRELPGALRAGGRALLFHQVPVEPGHDLAAWLAEAGVFNELTVLANPLSRPGAQWAYTRISAHRLGGASLRSVPGPTNAFGPPQTRLDLVRHVRTDDLLAARPSDLGSVVVGLHPWVQGTSLARVSGGQLVPAGRALDGRPVDDETWAVVSAIDGRSTVDDLAAGQGDVRRIVRELAEAGLVYLEDARQK
jgi:SAM-dependent methyltransferase